MYHFLKNHMYFHGFIGTVTKFTFKCKSMNKTQLSKLKKKFTNDLLLVSLFIDNKTET